MLRIKEFLLAPLNQTVSDLMDENFVALHVFDDQETAVEAFKKYDRVACRLWMGRNANRNCNG